MNAHSEDETVIQRGQEVALTKCLDWRSEEFKLALRATDYLFISSKFTSDGRRTGKKKGRLPRSRVNGRRFSTGLAAAAVPDLPENCYSEPWKKLKGEHFCASLNMRAPVDLSISKELNQ